MMEGLSLCSRLLCDMHIALLRLLQADMEEAHAVAGQGLGAASVADKAVTQSAACLEEAWAWGFDVDVWRAHLNALTWPEVSLLTASLRRSCTLLGSFQEEQYTVCREQAPWLHCFRH